jgi:hypothetical protein
MLRKNLKLLLLALIVPAALFLSSCDMVFIKDVNNSEPDNKELTEEERDDLELNGRFLKLTGMPANTQITNIFSVQIANSFSTVGKLNKNNTVFIFRETGSLSSTAYLPLVYNDESDFLETGFFYTAFSVHVDAVTSYVVELSDRFLVSYIDGRGEVDVNNLPFTSNPQNPDDTVEISEDEKNELELSGHFLKLVNMPVNFQPANVFSVQIANSLTSVGKLNKNNTIYTYRENNAPTSTIYLPLVYIDDNDFIETGLFYTAFTVHIDAVTSFVVALSDRFLIPFTNGRGEVDILNLPSPASPQNPDGSREISADEKSELELSGHYLKLVNMPPNTQAPNVFSVLVANSASTVAKLDKNDTFWIFREDNACSVYLPLIYNDNIKFSETGSFYTAFTIHIDAVTSYVVEISDRFLVSFTNGRGTVDIRNLPPPSVVVTDEPRYLTVYNLPSNVSIRNFSNVEVHNLAGPVAHCNNYSNILLSVNDNKTTAKIPLHYKSQNYIFSESGVYFVSFNINIDAQTQFVLSPEDKIKVAFVEGNGSLDILNIPDNPVPYLTLTGLPLNATKQQLSSVSVYNLAGSVAGSSGNDDVVIVKDGLSSTFLIPLSSSSGGYFNDSGRFAVSFTLNIDIDTQISYTRSDNLILVFTNGSASFDVNSFFGFFDAYLTNAADSLRPVIGAGSSFDVNGHRHTVNSNYTVNSLIPNFSCLLYLYVYYLDSVFFFEFSTAAPTYNSNRKGWYNGSRRALWKMIYINSSEQFLFKTYVDNNFSQLNSYVLSNDADYSQIIASLPVSNSIDGSNNPPAGSFTLEPGVYVIELKGAGGGSGRSYNSTSSGGSGGIIREIITLNAKTSFTCFTGSGGASAPAASASGTFAVVTTKNYFTYPNQTTDNGYTSAGSYFPNYTNTVLNTVTINGTDNAMSGGGGGGGGSGTFIYSSESTGNYLLIAGGGGGGSGGSYLTPGGAGGAGGAIGPGAGGGAAGFLSQSSDTGTSDWTSTNGHGGNGGGSSSGIAGQTSGTSSNRNGGNAPSVINSNSSAPGGTGVPSYSAPNFSVASGIPYLWYTTGFIINNTKDQSSIDIVSVCTTYSISANSGSGGGTPALSNPAGPLSWLNTNNSGGAGASPLALNPISVTGSITPNGGSDTVGTGTGPGTFNSVWNSSGTNAGNTRFASNLALTIGAARAGQSGSPGGNNRNSSKGGGAASGGAGSITVYKLH